jgi:hypothetical protein
LILLTSRLQRDVSPTHCNTFSTVAPRCNVMRGDDLVVNQRSVYFKGFAKDAS